MATPTVEFRLDVKGTPHTYIVIDNGNGVKQMYGFAPAIKGQLWGKGKIYNEAISGHEGKEHPHDYTTGPIQITAEQYNRMVAEIKRAIANPPDYNLLASIAYPHAVNQCATWVNHLAKVGGFSDKLPWGNQGWNPYGQAIWTELGKYWQRVEASGGKLDSTPRKEEIASWAAAYANQAATQLAQATKQAPAITPPTDLGNQRNSAGYLIDNGVNNYKHHTMTLKAGGTLSDVLLVQKNKGNAITLADLLTCNPHIADANKVQAGSTLTIPQKLGNGAIRYCFANGTTFTSNTTNGTYDMSIADGVGGYTQYTRTTVAPGLHILKQSSHQEHKTDYQRPLHNRYEQAKDKAHSTEQRDSTCGTARKRVLRNAVFGVHSRLCSGLYQWVINRGQHYDLNNIHQAIATNTNVIAPNKHSDSASLPSKNQLLPAIPESHYRRLRDTDNAYFPDSGGYFPRHKRNTPHLYR